MPPSAYRARRVCATFFIFTNPFLHVSVCFFPSLSLSVSAPGSPSSRLAQGEGAHWDDPEAGSVANHKPAPRQFYPIALLLVSSHLLVVWLILSLVFLLAKYQ